jgi:hypothetical protein
MLQPCLKRHSSVRSLVRPEVRCRGINGIANCAWTVSAVAGPVGAVDRVIGLHPRTHNLSAALAVARSEVHVSTPTKAKEQFDLSRTQAQLSEDVTEALKREIERLKISDKSAADERLQALSADRDELLASMTEGYEQAKQKARIAWLITLVPPAGMLVLGLCAAWIFRNFRPAAPKG